MYFKAMSFVNTRKLKWPLNLRRKAGICLSQMRMTLEKKQTLTGSEFGRNLKEELARGSVLTCSPPNFISE